MNECKFCGYYENQLIQCDACKLRDELEKCNVRLVLLESVHEATLALEKMRPEWTCPHPECAYCLARKALVSALEAAESRS